MRAAMQHALDALESWGRLAPDLALPEYDAAITTIKQALAQPDDPASWIDAACETLHVGLNIQAHDLRILKQRVRALYLHPAQPAKPLSAKQRTAVVICFDSGIVSVSMVQRKMGISYLESQALCQSIVDVGIMDGLEISPALESKIKERA